MGKHPPQSRFLRAQPTPPSDWELLRAGTVPPPSDWEPSSAEPVSPIREGILECDNCLCHQLAVPPGRDCPQLCPLRASSPHSLGCPAISPTTSTTLGPGLYSLDHYFHTGLGPWYPAPINTSWSRLLSLHPSLIPDMGCEQHSPARPETWKSPQPLTGVYPSPTQGTPPIPSVLRIQSKPPAWGRPQTHLASPQVHLPPSLLVFLQSCSPSRPSQLPFLRFTRATTLSSDLFYLTALPQGSPCDHRAPAQHLTNSR